VLRERERERERERGIEICVCFCVVFLIKIVVLGFAANSAVDCILFFRLVEETIMKKAAR
jgi:hypothetical protein